MLPTGAERGTKGALRPLWAASVRTWRPLDLLAEVPLGAAALEHPIAVSALPGGRPSSTLEAWLTRGPSLPPSEGHDDFLRELLEEIGFGGLPHLVSRLELDAFIRRGEVELFRGVTGPEFADALRRGRLYAGTGAAGNGIYTVIAARQDYARTKATELGTMVRMSLKAGARVVDDATLDLEMGDELARMYGTADEQIARLRATAPASGRREAVEREIARIGREADRRELLLYTDPGRFAAFKGYDAVRIEARGVYLVLNRTALRVEAG